MIDSDGFRANVAIILMNRHGKVFLGKRIRQSSWQFPQGGLNSGELPIEAAYRELHEEAGLYPKDVTILNVTPQWIYYRLPRYLIRRNYPLCIGQKQKWFLFRLNRPDTEIDLFSTSKPEFDDWRWVDYWYPLKQVIHFKKKAYQIALKVLHRSALNELKSQREMNKMTQIDKIEKIEKN